MLTNSGLKIFFLVLHQVGLEHAISHLVHQDVIVVVQLDVVLHIIKSVELTEVLLDVARLVRD
jgi:hypothetical protein